MSGPLSRPHPAHTQCKWTDHAPKAYAHAQSYTQVVNCRAAAVAGGGRGWRRRWPSEEQVKQTRAVQADCQACWSSCRRRCVYIENYPTYRVDVVADDDVLARGAMRGRGVEGERDGEGEGKGAEPAQLQAEPIRLRWTSYASSETFTVVSGVLSQIEKLI